jgi:hypothetical protein
MVSDGESKTVSSIRHSDRTVAFAYVFAMVLALAEVAADLGAWVELDIAVIYGIPLVLAAFTRNRRLLWGLMAALTTLTTYALQIHAGAFALREALFVNRVLDAVALLLTAGLLHVWTVSLDIRKHRRSCSMSRTTSSRPPTTCLSPANRRSPVRTRS